MEDSGIKVVILDNFSTLVDMPDENSASCMQPFQDFLLNMKQREISTLLVHHSKKYPNGQSMAYRGSQKLSVTFDNILQLAPLKVMMGMEMMDVHFISHQINREEEERLIVLSN